MRISGQDVQVSIAADLGGAESSTIQVFGARVAGLRTAVRTAVFKATRSSRPPQVTVAIVAYGQQFQACICSKCRADADYSWCYRRFKRAQRAKRKRSRGFA